MFCKKCGAQISDGAAFCENCGQPVQAAGQTAQAPDLTAQAAGQAVQAPDRTAQAAGQTAKQKGKKKKGILIIGIIVLLFLAFLAVHGLSGGGEPVVGKWDTVAVVRDGDVIPAFSDGYIDIKKDGSFFMWLNDELSYSGTWERYNGDLSSDVGVPYFLTFEDSFDRDLMTYDEDDKQINVLIGDIMIAFGQ